MSIKLCTSSGHSFVVGLWEPKINDEDLMAPLCLPKFIIKVLKCKDVLSSNIWAFKSIISGWALVDKSVTFLNYACHEIPSYEEQ